MMLMMMSPLLSCLPPTYCRYYYYYYPRFSIVNYKSSRKMFCCKAEVNVTKKEEEETNTIKVLCGMRSKYNDIRIVETHNDPTLYLLLDETHNVHSIYNKGKKWTSSYWDEFASLPAIVPNGPIAIMGLGGGTAAHLMLDLWPSLELEGWEIDAIILRIQQLPQTVAGSATLLSYLYREKKLGPCLLIDKAREYLGLSDLEKHTPAGGILHVRIGDALSPSVHVPGGYAGIVIDLFANGKVLPQLTEVATWLKLNDKLMPNGRLMVNCGAAEYEVPNALYPEVSSNGAWEKNLSIKAMCQAFPRQVNWRKMPKEEGENYLALTGPLPDLNAWSAAVPNRLSLSVNQWRPCFPQ